MSISNAAAVSFAADHLISYGETGGSAPAFASQVSPGGVLYLPGQLLGAGSLSGRDCGSGRVGASLPDVRKAVW